MANTTKTADPVATSPAASALRRVADHEEISTAPISRVIVNILSSGEVTFRGERADGKEPVGGYLRPDK